MKTPAILFALLCVLCGHAVAAEFDIRDEAEFRKCVPAAAKLEKIASDLGFSDLKNSRLHKWTLLITAHSSGYAIYVAAKGVR